MKSVLGRLGGGLSCGHEVLPRVSARAFVCRCTGFIETIGWPKRWADYVAYSHGLGRANFRAALDGYRTTRRKGDKEHRRRTDIAAGSISPQKLFGVPVGLMFYEGAARVLGRVQQCRLC